MHYGHLGQIERWRSSLGLAPLSVASRCSLFPDSEDCPTVPPPRAQATQEKLMPVVLGVSGGIVAVALLLVIVVLVKVAGSRRRTLENQLAALVVKVNDKVKEHFGPALADEDAHAALRVGVDDVKVGSEIGTGAFGIVSFGHLSPDKSPVAVKMLRRATSLEEAESFLMEGRLLSITMRHPNILNVLAIHDSSLPLMIVTEYLANGDLLSYMQRHASPKELTELVRTTILTQVASAMEFLAAQRVVHRDLAARNILIGADVMTDVRLSDFGMSRQLLDKTYYRRGNEGYVPIAWMPLEAIEKRIFSSKSDVWSFGVLAW